MSFQHDQMAHVATRRLLSDIRAGQAAWLPAGRLMQNTTYWQGVIDWPRPDNAFQDTTTGASLAIEFKPPGHGKAEYVRGVGQVLTYLCTFESSVLVMPVLANGGFHIAKYIADVLNDPAAGRLSVGLITYSADVSDLTTCVNVRPRTGNVPPIPMSGRKVFWGYWRDLSQFDLFVLLDILDRGRCDFDKAYALYWKKFRCKGRAQTWEGNARKIPAARKTFSSEQANDFLSFRHMRLIDSQKRLTGEAYDLLRHGKVYEADSQAFLGKLGHRVLMDGRHLELMFWVDETQREISPSRKVDHTTFLGALDDELQKAGIIPQISKLTGKPTFIRDEPKLWNKLRFLTRKNGRSYFFENEGYRFDWRQIMSTVNYG